MIDDQSGSGRPSRSAQKRAAQGIEELAAQLADLSDAKCSKLPVDADLRAEIMQARHLRAYGARKRQIKHLAAVLRQQEETTEALRAYVEGDQQQHRQETAAFHRLEELRDRLCQTDSFATALEEAQGLLPDLDGDAVSRLARSVHHSGDKVAYRKLFRLLKQAAGEGAG